MENLDQPSSQPTGMPPHRAWWFVTSTLRTKLLLAFLCVALIPLGLLAILNHRSTQTALADAANQSLFAAASQTAVRLDAFINANLNVIGAEAKLPALAEYLSLPPDERVGSEAEARVADILQTFTHRDQVFISSYALLDLQGRNVIDTHTPNIGMDESGCDYSRVALETGLPYASPVEFCRADGNAYLHFGSPVHNVAGESVGVLRARYSAAVLQQLVVQDNDLVGPQSFAILLDENRLLLAYGRVPHGSVSDLIFKSVVPLDPTQVAELQAARRLPQHLAEELFIDLPALGEGLARVDGSEPYFTAQLLGTGDRLQAAAVTRMKTQPWLVTFVQPQEVSLAPAQEQTRGAALLAVVIAGVVAAVAIGVAQLLARPITHLTAVARQVAGGDLEVQVPVATRDETGQLAEAFNTMTTQLRDLIGSLEQEINERMRAEEALRKSKTFLQTVIDGNPDYMMVIDRDYRILLANQAVRNTVVGKDPVSDCLACHQVSHHRDTPCGGEEHPCPLEQVIATKAPVTVTHTHYDAEGNVVYAEVSAAPIYDDAGEIVQIIESSRDVTERMRAEEALRESEQRLRDFLDNATDLIQIVAPNSRLIYVNRKWLEVLGYTASEVVNLSLSDTIHPDSMAHCWDVFQRILAGETVESIEAVFVAKDGTQVYVEGSASCRFEDGKPVNTRGIFHDITARKQAEEELRKHRDHLEELVGERTAELEIAKERAEAASHAKSVFLANMSHELRTPLNAILGYAQILQRRPLAPDVISALNTVQRSGEHLLTLINDILDIARIEAGRMELQPAPIHFPNFLEHIAGIIRSRAEAKGLTFNFETLNALPASVQADETRLRQVLLNLLDNAVKFTDAGHVTFRVQRLDAAEAADARHPAPHALLRFEVEDMGIGISPDQLERIFQPFEQARDLAHRTKGTGLGLAISRQLVRLMGGDLHVESEPGQGSLFWFEVALPVTEVAVEAIQPPARVITGYQGPRRRVLVVDDVPSNRAVVVDLLEPLGFEVIEAADGQQAIHLVQEIRPDLILMDRWMPVLDGFEAVRQMRQIPELKRVPTIAVSASVSAEDQAQSREVGIDAFLPKPVNWPALAALLEEHLELEWEYEGAAPEGEEAVEGPLVPPPQEELAVLHDLARRGDMRGIRERAAYIETLGEEYVPFARKLRELAKGFEERQILALIERCVEEKR